MTGFFNVTEPIDTDRSFIIVASSKGMKGGNEVSEANGITHSPLGELNILFNLWFAFGELRNYAPVGRSVTAFHLLLIIQ